MYMYMEYNVQCRVHTLHAMFSYGYIIFSMLYLVFCVVESACVYMYVYMYVITPLRGIWRVYTHDARGRVAPEGRGRIYQPNHKEGVL